MFTSTEASRVVVTFPRFWPGFFALYLLNGESFLAFKTLSKGTLYCHGFLCSAVRPTFCYSSIYADVIESELKTPTHLVPHVSLFTTFSKTPLTFLTLWVKNLKVHFGFVNSWWERIKNDLLTSKHTYLLLCLTISLYYLFVCARRPQWNDNDNRDNTLNKIDESVPVVNKPINSSWISQTRT